MPCIHCNSLSHTFLDCDALTMRMAAEENRYGYNFKPVVHSFCGVIKKCYLCFVKGDHDTLDCPDRFTAPEWFLPKIDRMLLLRFFKLFDNIELFSFVRECRDALKYVELKPFKVMNNFDDKTIEPSESTIVLLSCEMEKIASTKLTNLFNSKNIFFKVNSLNLSNFECGAEDLFRNITPTTNIIRLQNIKISPKIKFYDILAKLAHLTEIELIGTNIEITNDWPKIILKYCAGNGLKTISLQVNDYSIDTFNVDDLVKVMTTKSVKNVAIGLLLVKQSEYGKWLFLKQKLISKHFVQIKEQDQQLPCLGIFYSDSREMKCIAAFTLKICQNEIKRENLYIT